MAIVTRLTPRIGDVIEISTPNGLAYAQYTHKHAVYGALIRVFSTTFANRPGNFSSLVSQETQFSTFFPLGSACKRGVVKVVAAEPISPILSTFPIFRAGVANVQGKVETWWLWDGKQEIKVGRLLPNMLSYPIRGVINDTLLVERILEGWRHEHAI